MYRLLLFLKKIHVALLFILLELAAGYVFLKSSPYQRAVTINASNVVMGGIHKQTSAVSNYFSLSTENKRLAEENAKLRAELSKFEEADSIPNIKIPDKYIAARVINNSTSKQNNYITIDKGKDDGIEVEMALVNSDGIVGYILSCSGNFSVAVSVLNNKDFHTSGKLKGTDDTGNISWDGRDYGTVQIKGIPKYAQIQAGDTICTTQYSNIFPDNYPVGRVSKFELVNGTTFEADIELFTDMPRLKYVYAIQNPLQKERATLEKQTNNDK